MSDNIAKFSSITGNVSARVPSEGYLAEIVKFLKDTEILPEYSEDDVELEPPSADEYVLAQLTSLEKECFIISSLLLSVLNDEIVNIETSASDAITQLAKTDKIPMHIAALKYRADHPSPMSDENRILVNMISITANNVQAMYEWGVRARTMDFSSRLIVRQGFTVYGYE